MSFLAVSSNGSSSVLEFIINILLHDIIKFQERFLLSLGGMAVKDAGRRMINATLTNDLQLEFNWEEKSGHLTIPGSAKTGFKFTQLCRIILSKSNLLKYQFLTSYLQIYAQGHSNIYVAIYYLLLNYHPSCGGLLDFIFKYHKVLSQYVTKYVLIITIID